jgi:hypothetical protein
MKVGRLLSPRGRIGRLRYLGKRLLLIVVLELGSAMISLSASVVKPDWAFAHPRYVVELVCLWIAFALFLHLPGIYTHSQAVTRCKYVRLVLSLDLSWWHIFGDAQGWTCVDAFTAGCVGCLKDTCHYCHVGVLCHAHF